MGARLGYRFAAIPEWVLYHHDLEPIDVRVFGVLCRLAHFRSDPSLEELGAKIGASKSTVHRSIARLHAVGALAIETQQRAAGGHDRHVYHLAGDDRASFTSGTRLTSTNGQTRRSERVSPAELAPSYREGLKRDVSHADTSACAAHPYWEANPDTLKTLEAFAPPALLDGDLAAWCDQITDGTGVYWDHQMREYVAWLETKPKSRRHKNLPRGFKAWVQEAIRRDQRRSVGAQGQR